MHALLLSSSEEEEEVEVVPQQDPVVLGASASLDDASSVATSEGEACAASDLSLPLASVPTSECASAAKLSCSASDQENESKNKEVRGEECGSLQMSGTVFGVFR